MMADGLPLVRARRCCHTFTDRHTGPAQARISHLACVISAAASASYAGVVLRTNKHLWCGTFLPISTVHQSPRRQEVDTTAATKRALWSGSIGRTEPVALVGFVRGSPSLDRSHVFSAFSWTGGNHVDHHDLVVGLAPS